jgi:galactose mutarotase-like enzyme
VLAVVNNVVPLKYELFENDALIFKSLQSRYLTILKNQTPLLRVHYSGFPHLGIWTKINAPFLCIEPWFGYSDSVESTGNLMEKKASNNRPRTDFFGNSVLKSSNPINKTK